MCAERCLCYTQLKYFYMAKSLHTVHVFSSYTIRNRILILSSDIHGTFLMRQTYM